MELTDVGAKLAAYLPGQVVAGVERLAAGWETDVYGFTANGRSLVLRVYAGGDPRGQAGAEAEALKRLGALGYPVPRLEAFDPDPARFGGPFLIMERVAGRPLYTRPDAGPVFVSLLARLHSLQVDDLNPGAPNTFDLTFLESMAGVSGLQGAVQPIFDRLRREEPLVGRERRCIIHGDFHMSNILVTDQGAPYVIDWSCALLDDPRVDVAQAAVLALTSGSPDVARAIVAGYEAATGRPLEHFGHFELLALARRVMSIVMVVVQGSASIGLRPWLEVEMRRAVPQIHGLVQLLEQRSGVALAGVHQALATIPE